MSIDLWEEGVIVEFSGAKPCHRAIIRSVGKSEVILADVSTGSRISVGRKDLDDIYESGGARFLAESRDFGELKFADLTEKEQKETNRKYRYIKKLTELGVTKITEKSSVKIIREVASEINEKPPHWQSVRGWYRSFVESGSKMRGLYPRHRFKGDRAPKIDQKVLQIIKEAAKRYFNKSQPSMASVYRNIEDKIIEHNLDHPDKQLKVPNYLTVQARVLETSYQSKQKSRQGIRTLQAELASSESGIETTRVLERVEIDHTLLDIHLLHDDYKTLLGRPNITVLIDHYSHMVLGFQLSFEPPSFASVCIACINAFLPKDAFMDAVDSDGVWPAHGVPTTLVTDNGNEFWGKYFSAVADELGSAFQYCPIRKGNYKSRVERFFGIVNSLVLDDLPGVVRKAGKCGDGYDGRQEATITFSEFKKHLVDWITGVHHHKPVEGLGMTPYELWVESENDFPVPIEDEMELLPILMATETRQLSKGGIRKFVLDYNSDLLKDLYRRDGPGTVTVKYNLFDIGYILVLDSVNKVYLKVECEDFEYASGLSAFEHGKIREVARATGKSKLDNLDLQKARVKLSKEREEFHARNSRRKTQVTTSKAARSEKVGVTDIKLVIDNSKHVVQAELDSADDDLDLGDWSVD
ncbi:Mu transposase C-terminal domain-containing protein [Teredinibacter turnerae]|uniref:Mu transposase C-terminal domain-containing protein n=1 Tax=Teredinibacter turnerae TaxID=2426 RepID=UPI0004182012|nr:Mu transposase C-terminal domain-containing protein [Teredinibacter turnerae]